ncbi:MAG TPA: hypothetical protein VGL89_16600 [Candidatus Koribacter sp.]|jgi:hypothetical protein
MSLPCPLFLKPDTWNLTPYNLPVTLPEAIAETARLLRSAIPDNEIIELLTALDVSRSTAEEILAFLPLTYGRELLRRSGCTDFPTTCARRLPDGTLTLPITLSRKPVWRACEAFLHTDLASGSHGDDVLLLANLSPEFQHAHRALDQGADLQDLTFDPLILTTTADGPVDEKIPPNP